MKRLVLLFALMAGALMAQDSINVTTNIVATAGTGTNQVTCTVSRPQPPAIQVQCFIGTSTTATLTSSVTVPAGSNSGASGTFVVGGNTVGWVLAQPTANTYTYQVAANAVTRTGNF